MSTSYDGFNPEDPFQRLLVTTCEAERRDAADKAIAQYARGILTVEELRDRLQIAIDLIQPLGSEL